jgi:Holliday junction resolvase RusA-like endonuclease
LEFPKPDVDNFCKAVFDALNGVVYKDDSQIIGFFAQKAWGNSDMIFFKLTEN